MGFLFGQLTQLFVSFGSAQSAYYQDPNNATALQELQVVAAQFRSSAALNASYLVYIGTSPSPLLHLVTHTLKGIGALVCTFVYMIVWVYTGEVNTKRIREKYLQAVLRQEIAYFDTVGAGEVATRIQTDTRMSLSPLAHSTLTPSFHRSRTARHVRKGRPRHQLYRFFHCRFYHRLCSLLETRPCIVFYYSLHGSHRGLHK
jgi:ABC-type multidrug transport system fused ATPase/permease subunit